MNHSSRPIALAVVSVLAIVYGLLNIALILWTTISYREAVFSPFGGTRVLIAFAQYTIVIAAGFFAFLGVRLGAAALELIGIWVAVSSVWMLAGLVSTFGTEGLRAGTYFVFWSIVGAAIAITLRQSTIRGYLASRQS